MNNKTVQLPSFFFCYVVVMTQRSWSKWEWVWPSSLVMQLSLRDSSSRCRQLSSPSTLAMSLSLKEAQRRLTSLSRLASLESPWLSRFRAVIWLEFKGHRWLIKCALTHSVFEMWCVSGITCTEISRNCYHEPYRINTFYFSVKNPPTQSIAFKSTLVEFADV